MPCHHNLEDYLDEYIEATGISSDQKLPLVRSTRAKTGKLTDRALAQSDIDRMLRRRALAAGIDTEIRCHTFRATGITAYLKNGGQLELAQRMANHESARTTGLYDRRNNEVSLDEVERIQIRKSFVRKVRIRPVVLLLHGLPDTAQSWSHQLTGLAAAGYRAVAPFLRGYSPTEVPVNRYYAMTTLATDVSELIRALGGGPVYLVGQDWGASIGYAVVAAFPELVRRAVLAAVPHPAQVRKSLLDARHVHRSFHWWFFQFPELPEKAIVQNDFKFIDYLWRYWSSPGFADAALVSAIQAIQQRPPEIIMKLLFIGTGAIHGLGYQETCKLNPLEQGQADRPEAAP